MKLRLRLPLLLIFILAVANAFGQTPANKGAMQPDAKAKAQPTTTPTPESTKSPVLLFPAVAGWEKDEIYVYPMAGGGYSVNYNSPTSGRVTVYAYTSGHATIPNELKGVVRDELETAKMGIQSAVDAGVYTNVKEGKTETVVLGGSKGKVNSLRSSYTLSRGNSDMRSDIYIFPYKNQFIKLRVTRPATTDKTADDAFALLLSELDTFFAK